MECVSRVYFELFKEGKRKTMADHQDGSEQGGSRGGHQGHQGHQGGKI